MGMIDIGMKAVTQRKAIACGKIVFGAKAFKIFLKEGSPKGNILETAKIAAIMAAKNTPQIIPLCHPIALEKVSISFEILKAQNTIKVMAEVDSSGKTGVEMEALTAVSAACLTIYDMMKFTGQNISISAIELMHKSGGKSGTFNREGL